MFDAPDYLDDDARAVWVRVAPPLIERGTLVEHESDLFAAYCTAVVHHRRAADLVNRSNVLLKNSAGAVKHPAMQVLRDQAAVMASLAKRWQLDVEPEQTPADVVNYTAAVAVVESLTALGRIEDVDRAAVQAFLALARAVDTDPSSAALWAQYRASEETLRGLGVNATPDPFERWMSGAVRDTAVDEP